MKPLTHEAVPEQALAWHQSEGAVLATVITTWGSAPRPVGSQATISASGAIAGSVSGGCVEGAIIAEAAGVLATGQPRIFEFGVADDDAFAVGLACGGQIRILVEPIGGLAGLSPALLEDLVEYRRARQPVALLTNTRTWQRRLVDASVPDGTLPLDLKTRMRDDRSGQEDDWFVTIFNPPLRLIIVGAVHIAQPLVTMAALCNYDVTVIDPRETFATQDRFPDCAILTDWPDEVLASLQPDSRTALVTLTHDPKIDDAALADVLGSRAFYIGSLGSRRTHAKRLGRLRDRGLDEQDLLTIRAPIGTDIGAATPAEIAVAIMAEVTLTLRRRGHGG